MSSRLVEQFLFDLYKSELITIKEIKEKYHRTMIQSAEAQEYINTISGIVFFTEKGLKIVEDLDRGGSW